MNPIPGPQGLPIIGNLLDIRHEEGFIKAAEQLADTYGPVYQLTGVKTKSILISSAELLMHFADEKNFVKEAPQALASDKGAQGLFTVASGHPDWYQAHRILAPAFGPLSVGEMFEEMRDIAIQLCEKWARLGQDTEKEFLLTDDFTRLTLDTIALCAMDFRFNSFYSDKMHPFVDAMLSRLEYSGKRSNLPALYNMIFARQEEAKFKEDGQVMMKVSRSIIERRRQNPIDKPDMLNTLLYGKDPVTGETMRDELIMAKMITFLVAGHETTSGLLSFLFHNLMQSPMAYLKAREEVDKVVGNGTIQLHHLKDLKYLNAAIRETLRLAPTAPVITKSIVRKDEFVTICDGKYHIPPDALIRLLLGKAMRDPAYFGNDADNFVPERMLESHPNFDKHMACWKPFGNGSRSCIGQSFALQEALLVAALVLQNFDLNLADPSYVMRVKQTLTIKPRDLWVKVKLRQGLTMSHLTKRLYGKAAEVGERTPTQDTAKSSAASTDEKINILYGSNSGTCSSLAHKLASAITRQLGMAASVDYLDSAVDNMSSTQPTILITASYEGQPPDNAARFTTWLETSTEKDLSGVKYAVFGCGHKDWKDTLHRIPRLLDRLLDERGGDRILDLGTSDVSQGKVLDDFEDWQQQLFQTLKDQSTEPPAAAQVQSTVDLAEISKDSRATQLSSGLSQGKVKAIKILTAPGQPEKRHMEVEMPPGTEYECGDYLAVLPMNSESLVKKIMAHWELPWDATITFKSKAFGNVPVGEPLSIFESLRGYFELSQQASKSNFKNCIMFTSDDETKQQLQAYISDDMQLAMDHTSLFDVLKEHPLVKMPFTDFLSNLLPLHIRQYSISSSPMCNQQTCTITYSVVKSIPSAIESNDPADTFEGVASSYLASLKAGDTFQMAVRKTATAHLPCAFRLPQGTIQAETPLLMFCAGTGLAPFRGFVEQRAMMLEQNPSLVLAPALLFIGCRSSSGDQLYADELAAWQKLGAVDVRYAFSQESDHKLAAGCKYVGDRIVKDMDDVSKIWQDGAKVYVCGGRRLQENIREGVMRLFEQVARREQWTDEMKEERRENFRTAVAGRAVSDIFD